MLRTILYFILFFFTLQLSAQVDAINNSYTVPENTGSNTISLFDVQTNDNLAGNSSCTNQSTIVTNVVNGVCVRHTNGKDFNYYSNIGYYGVDSFKYRLTGCNDGSIDEAWVYITITPINQAPIATDDYYTVNEDQIDTFFVQSNDHDRENGTLTSTIFQSPLKGTASIPILTYIRYIPNANYVGFDTLEYRVCDNGIGGSPSLCDEAFVYIKILPKDDPLAIIKSDTTLTTKEDSFICVNLSSMVLDVDNENNWVASGQTSPRNGTAVYNGQTVCYYPSANFNGKDSFIVLARDTNNNTVLIKVYVNVTPINDTIKAINDTLLVNMNSNISFDPGVNDKNIDNLSYSLSNITNPSNGGYTTTGNLITYTPRIGFYGLDSQNYSISTLSINYKSTAKIFYKVIAPPSKPKAVSDYYLLLINTNRVITPFQNDFDGYLPLTYNVYKNPKHVSLTPGSTITEFNAISTTYKGYDTAYYSICNSMGCDSSYIVFYVSENTKPNTKKDTTTLLNPGGKNGCLTPKTVQDADTPLHFYVSQTTKNNPIILDSNGCWTYNYTEGFEGIDSFIFIVCDNGNPKLCDTQVHYIAVNKDKSPITVSNSISPNGDGIMDYLNISNLNLTSANDLMIFNRWGDIIYQKNDYKNDWYGTNDKSGINNSELLPDGVYYYIFNYTIAGDKFQKTGYIYLKK